MRPPQNRLKRELGLISFLALLLIVSCKELETGAGESNKEKEPKPELLDRTKRNLVAKEKEYLKHKPLSDEMRTFIKRFRRKTKRDRTVDEDKINRMQQHDECETDRIDTPESGGDRLGPSSIKSVDTKLLSKVMQDLQKLTDAENEAKLKGESTDCRVEGDWDSNAGGMQIRMEFRNDTHHPDAKLVDRDPPMEEGFLAGKNWSISALVPFTKASSVVLNLYTVKGKRVISIFTGECRICDGEETIAGSWIIQRHSKDCKDRHLSQKFITDVLKKNNVRELQQQNLREMEGTSTQGTR